MVGIVGFGFVGSAVYSGFKYKQDVVIYDPPKGYDDIGALSSTDALFVCLPTPSGDDGQDFDIVGDFLDYLVESEYCGLVIVKSTCLFSNLEPYNDKLRIVFNPEFLNQNSHIDDFANQRVIVLGGEVDDCFNVVDVYNNYFDVNSKFEVMSMKEATEVKYFHNVYHAYKILFWNFVQEQTDNQRKIFDVYCKIRDLKQPGNEIARICADGKPGYGGACFPKDVKALHFGIGGHELTDFMIKYNDKLRF